MLAIASTSSWSAGESVRDSSKREKGKGKREKGEGLIAATFRLVFQQGNGRPEMRFWRVVKALHQWMLLERGLDDGSLNAAAPPVNQSNLSKPSCVCSIHVLFNN